MTNYFWIFGFRLTANGLLMDNHDLAPPGAHPADLVTSSTPGIPPSQPHHQETASKDSKGTKSGPPPVLLPVQAKDDDLTHLFFVNSPVFSDEQEQVALEQAQAYIASGQGRLLYVKSSNAVLYKTVDAQA